MTLAQLCSVWGELGMHLASEAEVQHCSERTLGKAGTANPSGGPLGSTGMQSTINHSISLKAINKQTGRGVNMDQPVSQIQEAHQVT